MKTLQSWKSAGTRSLFMLLLLGATLLTGVPQAPAQHSPAPSAQAPSSAPPATPITTRTFNDLARKVIPSVVTVYVKRDLIKSLTPDQREQLDRLRKFYSDPNMRRFMPFSPFGQGDEGNGENENGEGEGDSGGDDESGIITQGSGSGVIVSPDGYVVTNWHVVGNKADQAEIRVVMPSGEELSGKDVQLIESSQFTDLALLKINRSNLPALPFGDSDQVQIGDWVAAVGSPLELRETITQGIVSAKHREFGRGMGDMIQTDAAINPGSSGGALVNLNGEVIGINRMIATLGQGWAGYGFAIPSNQVKYFVDQVRTQGKVSYGYIGIFMANEAIDTPKMRQALGIDRNQKGVLVMGTSPGSPAEKAGFQEGDFITEVDGRKITTSGDLLSYVARRPVGSSIRVSFLRPGEGAKPKPMNTTLQIAQRPTEDELNAAQQKNGQKKAQPKMQENRLGVQVEPYQGPDGQGLRVTRVAPGSVAAKAGIQSGDVLLRLNFIPLRTEEDLRKALESRPKGEPAPLSFMRNGQRNMTTIE